MITTNFDLDGDGENDRRIVVSTGTSRDVTTTWEDYEDDGDVAVRLTETRLANGAETVLAIDRDGNGEAEVRRSVVVETEADGDRVTIVTESFAPTNGNLGLGRVSWRETTTTSGDGLTSTTTYNVDGDSDIEATSVRTTTIAADGARTEIEETRYGDTTLRERVETHESRDGRTWTQSADYDGNGALDHSIVRVTAADGTVTETETSFNEAGVRGQVFVTTTSADGLETHILRPGGEQTILRSVTGNGSYTWNNGLTAALGVTNIVVSHRMDAFGVESWTQTSSTKVYVGSFLTDQVTTATVRFDAAAKAEILADAARLYDAILDRDMDYEEIETLVSKISEGRLDTSTLADALIGSAEFSTRHGTLAAADFVTQLYLNALQRGPTLAELDHCLRALNEPGTAVDTAGRVALAVELADSAEHQVTGNGHLATNNLDVIMNPAQFERSLDRIYVEEVARALVDVVYDREATENEVAWISEELLTGTKTNADIATALLAEKGDVFGVAIASLNGLSGAALVEQAFINALGRQPSALEQIAWEENLSSGRVTAAAFVTALALSVEHMADGHDHEATGGSSTLLPGATTGNDSLIGTSGRDSISGGDGNDTLLGGSSSDWIEGGKGNDSLAGGYGSDSYWWSSTSGAPSGNDTINDGGTSFLEEDRLILSGVAEAGVTLARSGTSIVLTVTATGETVTLQNMLSSATTGSGIEAIQFTDKVWGLEDILSHTVTTGAGGGSGADSLLGTDFGDNIVGGLQNDTLRGGDGDDTIVGGTGVDSVDGANGGDTYIWTRGDGIDPSSTDVISDSGASQTEIDCLAFTDTVAAGTVTPGQVTLTRADGSADLIVTIAASGTSPQQWIKILNQFANTPSGTGIERITFGDGTIWSLEYILQHTSLFGSSGVDTLDGNNSRDSLFGGSGDDTLRSYGGDDTLKGGTGADSLIGAAGGDTYLWALNDGNDAIDDQTTSATDLDVLVLEGIVSSTTVALTRTSGSTDLTVTVPGTGGATLTATGQFAGTGIGKGVEEIVFSDGVTWTLADIYARTQVKGSVGNVADTLVGLSYVDNIFGGDGADSITGAEGDDFLKGGTGNDTIDGGIGNDRFEWATGDGNDLIRDTSTSLTEVDTLNLAGVDSSGATLTKSGTNLVITIGTGGAAPVLTVENGIDAANPGKGIEIIEFADGATIEILTSAVATNVLSATMTSGADNPTTTWNLQDVVDGLGGNDTLNGKGGDDTLKGGLGTDSLVGGTGSDSFVWCVGDGNDTINDAGTSQTEIDTLIFAGLDPGMVTLTRTSGTTSLLVGIDTNGDHVADETITVLNRFGTATSGAGIEAIRFIDITSAALIDIGGVYGTLWTLDDILANTRTEGASGGTGADSLSGTAWRDNLYGGDGNDTLSASAGNDYLYGGTGNDSLVGSTGNDSYFYVWSASGGSDTINETSTSTAETDTLVLSGVLASNILLTRTATGTSLLVQVNGTTPTTVVTVLNEFGTSVDGKGIERIVFDDGTSWDQTDIFAKAVFTGTGAAENLAGWVERDNIQGGGGNDTIDGNGGDDWLYGGAGVDTLTGDTGSDHYVWTLSASEGNDTINDYSASLADTDTLVLRGVTSGMVTLHRPPGTTDMIVRIADGASTYDITVKFQIYDPAEGWGLERILFQDAGGTTTTGDWNLDEILSQLVTYGTTGADTLTGTAFGDNLVGDAGNDVIYGGAGNDSLNGNAGADTLDGGTGVDRVDYYDSTGTAPGVVVDLTVSGAQGGTAGSWSLGDVLTGIENVKGTLAADQITGSVDSNVLDGLDGNDTILGLDGFDQITGGTGNDSLNGGDGADSISGGDGTDSIQGGNGDDSIEGGNDNDSLYGGAGEDILGGDAGNDLLTGDDPVGTDAADVFTFRPGFGQDTIADWDGLDRIDLTQLNAIVDYADLIANHLSQSGSDALINAGGGNTIRIVGIAASSLTLEDFMF